MRRDLTEKIFEPIKQTSHKLSNIEQVKGVQSIKLRLTGEFLQIYANHQTGT